MARRIPEQELQAIIDILEHYPDGATTAQIEQDMAVSLSRRTLNYRIKHLVTTGRIEQQNKGRWAKYFPATEEQPTKTDTPEAQTEVQASLFVPLSKEGGKILRIISGPPGSRTPVAYNRAFLEDYRPNITSYLSVNEKSRLLQLGTTKGLEQAAGTYALQMLSRLLIDLSWNSSRLEGNTYSLLETQKLIELGQSVEGKAPRDAQMILNHKAAIEFLVQSADEISFNRRTILNLHALLADNLLDDPSAAGRLRREGVGIGGSVYMPPEIPQVIEDCFETVLSTAEAIKDPFEQAFFVMIQLPYLQPFIDVNKRVSRLAMNIPMIRNNLAPLSFISVPDATYTHGLLGVYELNRIDLIKDMFLWAYEKSSARYVALRQTLGEPDPFRLRYRTALRDIVSSVILQGMEQISAAQHIASWATENIEEIDRAQFIEAAETELLSLHEGNFARYAVRPSEYDAWRKVWES